MSYVRCHMSHFVCYLHKSPVTRLKPTDTALSMLASPLCTVGLFTVIKNPPFLNKTANYDNTMLSWFVWKDYFCNLISWPNTFVISQKWPNKIYVLQDPFFHKNLCYFWSNYWILVFFEIWIIVDLSNLIYCIPKKTVSKPWGWTKLSTKYMRGQGFTDIATYRLNR